MTSQTRLAILGLTVGTWLVVRETVAMDTLAARAMVRMSMRSVGLLSTAAGFAFLVAILSWMGREACGYQHSLRPHRVGRRQVFKSAVRFSLTSGGRSVVAKVLNRRMSCCER